MSGAVPMFTPIRCDRGRHRLHRVLHRRRGPAATGLLVAAAALLAGHQPAADGPGRHPAGQVAAACAPFTR